MKKYKHAISSFYHATAAKFWARYGNVFKNLNAFHKAYRHMVSAEAELLEFKFQSMK